MYKRKHKIEWIVIDYLQLVPWDRKMKKNDGIAEVSHQVKLMAMELDVPVFLLAQVNREGAKRESGLTLYDLKDSGDIENDSDIILLLWPDGKDVDEARRVDAEHGAYVSLKYNIAKQREGSRDVKGKFIFKNHIGRFH
jgi:replicative DNA helicase